MSIFLCSHSDAVRERWHDALNPFHREVYQTSSISELNGLAGKFKVDLLLLHRDIASAETVLQLRRSLPDCRIFILTNRPDPAEGLEFLQYGIVGYANTYMAAARLAEAVQAILSGSAWIGQDLIQLLIRKSLGGERKKKESPGDDGGGNRELLAGLSNREYEIANLVAQGLSNFDIASRLAITERTVKAHLSSIYAKTGTRGRLNLALMINRGN
jgi:DNA-binding NarL/FixJ family response regulator